MEAQMTQVVQRIGLAMALGLIVGLERLRAGKEAGIRTFSLTAVAGSLSQLAGLPYLGLVALSLTGVLVVITNLSALGKGNGPELTTSVALVVTSFAGILTGQGQVFAPVVSMIGVMMLLAWKDEMVDFSHHLTREEVHAAITLLLLGLVILPVLPSGTIDPWHLVDLRKVWITIVLISGIGFVNYILLRLYGARGVTYTGFLGGLVNSTATVAEMVNHIKKGGEPFADFAFRGIMLAKTAMVLRNTLILGILAPAALPAGLLPGLLMLAVTVTLAVRGMRNGGDAPPPVSVRSPFSLRAALEFGAYFLILTVGGGIAQRFLGTLGFYAVSLFGGAVSSSSTAATAATLARQGEITNQAAAMGVVLSSIASALVLLPLVARGGRGTTLGRRVGLAAALMIVAAAAGLFLNHLFLPYLESWDFLAKVSLLLTEG